MLYLHRMHRQQYAFAQTVDRLTVLRYFRALWPAMTHNVKEVQRPLSACQVRPRGGSAADLTLGQQLFQAEKSFDISLDFGGKNAGDLTGGNMLRNYGTSSNHRLVTNGCSRENHIASTNPNAAGDGHVFVDATLR